MPSDGPCRLVASSSHRSVVVVVLGPRDFFMNAMESSDNPSFVEIDLESSNSLLTNSILETATADVVAQCTVETEADVR